MRLLFQHRMLSGCTHAKTPHSRHCANTVSRLSGQYFSHPRTFLNTKAIPRAGLRSLPLSFKLVAPGVSSQHRTIFIQTENTPNTDALKFLPNCQILPQELSSPFLEYLSPRSTLAPPYPSPLAARLLGVDGITSVFYGPNFITITKAADAIWAHVKPEIFSLITEAVNSGEPVVSATNDKSSPVSQGGMTLDSLAYNESDSEVVGMIKELLETRIRPAIQDDGGDVDFCGFQNGKVLLKLRGACRTCDSSTVTLRNGIESMLMHYIEEVKGITQVMDESEITSNAEFTRFEENLRERRRFTENSAKAEGKPAEG